MTDYRSFYLELKKNDIAGSTEATLDVTDIPFIEPANDNSPAKARLATLRRTLFRRLSQPAVSWLMSARQFHRHTP
jgi:hypothetical protein